MINRIDMEASIIKVSANGLSNIQQDKIAYNKRFLDKVESVCGEKVKNDNIYEIKAYLLDVSGKGKHLISVSGEDFDKLLIELEEKVDEYLNKKD